MTITNLEHVLLCCFALNYGVLIFWWVLIMLPHGWMYRLSRVCKITDEKFDQYNFLGMMIYKILNALFTLIPYIALRIVMG